METHLTAPALGRTNSGMFFAGIYVIEGIVSIIKHFPSWGFTWLVASIIGFLLLLKNLAEERGYFISSAWDWALFDCVFLYSVFVLAAAARRYGQTAGLVREGFLTITAFENLLLVDIPLTTATICSPSV